MKHKLLIVAAAISICAIVPASRAAAGSFKPFEVLNSACKAAVALKRKIISYIRLAGNHDMPINSENSDFKISRYKINFLESFSNVAKSFFESLYYRHRIKISEAQ